MSTERGSERLPGVASTIDLGKVEGYRETFVESVANQVYGIACETGLADLIGKMRP